MFSLTILGLGLCAEQLTAQAKQLLESGARVVLRTKQCAAAEVLSARGVAFEALDELYEASENFDELNRRLSEAVEAQARAADTVYGVIDLRDESVSALLARRPDAHLVAGVPVDGALTAFDCAPCVTLAAADRDGFQPDSDLSALIREIGSRELASEVKLRLMERYPEEQRIYLLDASGIRESTLEDLDRQSRYDHTLCAFVPAERALHRLERYGFAQLNRIIRVLRAPGGCPWDRAQTHESLRANLVEEAWEVVDAIDRGEADELYEELGDLLLQVALHAEIARQHGQFTVDDVTSAICHKMIARHRHVFGDAKAHTPEQVSDLWERVKREERHLSGPADAMREVTAGLPALMRAEKVLKKAGIADPAPEEALQSAEAAIARVRAGDPAALGEALFSLCDAALRMNQEAELLLKHVTDCFIDRFSASDNAM